MGANAGRYRTRRAAAEERRGVAEALTRWRTRAGFTKEFVAANIERALSTVQRWERGLSEPQVSDVRAMERLSPGLVQALFRRWPRG